MQVLLLTMKIVQINSFDAVRAWFYRQNGKGNFNVWNYVLINLLWQTLLAGHFYLFNFIYYQQSESCVGYSSLQRYGSTEAFFNDQPSFVSTYSAVFIAQALLSLAYLVVIGHN